MCECCKYIKELNKMEKEMPTSTNIKRELRATLTSISKRKGQKKPCGVISFKNYELNYCPMCGRKLNSSEQN